MVEAHPQIYAMPAYRASKAARILALPVGTVNAWCFGHDYRHGDGTRKRFHRVIEPAEPQRRELSFVNLCELHLLAVIRRHRGIKLAKVRQAIDFLRRELRVPRPLATQRFLTNGVALFVEHAGELLNVSEQGQQALRDASQRDSQPRSVLVDPARSFGRLSWPAPSCALKLSSSSFAQATTLLKWPRLSD